MSEYFARLRRLLFRNVLHTIQVAQTGHLGACCSSLDLMLVLYFGGILRYDSKNPRHPFRDYVLNRGHLGPLKYNIFHLLGWLEKEEMDRYRQFGSRLPGHEDMKITPGVDVTPSGSLGMGLSYAVGALIGFRDLKMPNRVFCFLGDGEECEGNVYEAARHAGYLKLKRLICVIDRNGGQLSTRTAKTDSADLKKVWSGYGWQTINLANGHNHRTILAAYKSALRLAEKGPVVIFAKTEKGHGIPGAKEDYCGFHVFHGAEVKDTNENTRPIDIESVLASLEEKLSNEKVEVRRQSLPTFRERRWEKMKPIKLPPKTTLVQQYDIEYEFIEALEKQVGERLYIFTADYPPRNFVYGQGEFPLKNCHYYNVSLREQHMTALTNGLAKVRKDAVIIVLCGDAFLYRHMDQMNVLAQAEVPVIFYSVQGGLSGAKNGSTHQSAGQPGALLTMPGVVCEEPCAAREIIRSSNDALERKGPTYIRLEKMPVPWNLKGRYEKGYGAVRHFPRPDLTIVASGLTALNAFEAGKKLQIHHRIRANVINVICLSGCAGVSKWIAPGKPLLLLYNGNPEILEYSVYADLCRAGRRLPSKIVSRGFKFGRTGSMKELMSYFKLDTDSIVETCKKLVQ